MGILSHIKDLIWKKLELYITNLTGRVRKSLIALQIISSKCWKTHSTTWLLLKHMEPSLYWAVHKDTYRKINILSLWSNINTYNERMKYILGSIERKEKINKHMLGSELKEYSISDFFTDSKHCLIDPEKAFSTFRNSAMELIEIYEEYGLRPSLSSQESHYHLTLQGLVVNLRTIVERFSEVI